MKQSTLGSYIRSLRIQNELTQAQLASLLGVTDKAVSKWERDRSCPDLSVFPKLADILGVTVDDLLKENTAEAQPSRLLQIFDMSHDIRTPLHIIIGCADLAGRYRDDPEKLDRYLESIRISGEYLLETVDRLMQVAGQGAAPSRTEEPSSASGDSSVGDAPTALPKSLFTQKKARENALQKYDFSGRRILIAEDVPMNREIIAEILAQTGALTEFAEDGQLCVEMMEQAPEGYYDLILMDIMMPNMDGIEATRRIRQLHDPIKAAIPIVAVSANVYGKNRKTALEAGMDAFAEKPVDIGGLLKTLGSLLK